MKKIIASNLLNNYPAASAIIEELTQNSETYGLTDTATLYFGFPRFVGYEEETQEPNLLILSPNHGIFVLRFVNESDLSSVFNQYFTVCFLID